MNPRADILALSNRRPRFRRRPAVLLVLIVFATAAADYAARAADISEVLVRTRPATVIVTNGDVRHQPPQHPPTNAVPPLGLTLGDTLFTLARSSATLTNIGEQALRLGQYTRLELVPFLRPALPPNAPPFTGGTRSNDVAFLQTGGQIYFSSRGRGPHEAIIITPQMQIRPVGTEYVVAVDPEKNETRVTMLDGEARLSDATTTNALVANQEAIAISGQGIRIRPLLATNIVQWWLYYPAVLDAGELHFTPPDRERLSASLDAYQRGDIPNAMRKFPGYPMPAAFASDAEKIFFAALLLSAGGVDECQKLLASLPADTAPSSALRILIAAIQTPLGTDASTSPDGAGQGVGVPLTNPVSRTKDRASRSVLLALSYAHQATNNLKAALAASREAANTTAGFGGANGQSRAPSSLSEISSGFAFARVAELEFSLGLTRAARTAAQRALDLSPRHAPAYALNGFLLAAEYRFHEALAAFDRAIELDPVLANAWLGRGLVKRRMGFLLHSRGNEARDSIPDQTTRATAATGYATPTTADPDWLSDLRTAAILEPTRSLTRSYLGKAFSDVGAKGAKNLALSELDFAAKLDPHDPTPPLYKALELYQENRPNEAIRELERSITLNDNRAVYRPRLLLDQDHAVRGASLAKIYQAAGLDDVALREAARAVSYDYANPAAHQFLAESYNALRDPTRFNLRYETVWFNELLLANLLSPVGAGLLSQNISQQEYSRLFERNRVGLSSSTEVRSDGQYREIASHYGLLGRLAYTLDLDYQHNNGVRPNNDLDRKEWFSQFKYQLTDRDSVFLLTEYTDYESGHNFQRYNPALAARSYRLTERHTPQLAAAIHREWRPGFHTTLLGAWLNADQDTTGVAQALDLRRTNATDVDRVVLRGFTNSHQTIDFDAGSLELNQVWQSDHGGIVAGGRFQKGDFSAASRLVSATSLPQAAILGTNVFTNSVADFQRWTAYAYATWRPVSPVALTAGITYDDMSYPANFRFAPVGSGERHQERWSPKASLIWDMSSHITLRGLYAEALGGAAFDDSFRLEPTQLAGFAQAFRTVISEGEVGSVSAPRHRVGGLALDFKLPGGTYANIAAQRITSDVDQNIGVFYNTGLAAPPIQAFPGLTREQLRYREDSVSFTIQRLLGDCWAVNAGYAVIASELRRAYPGIPNELPRYPGRTEDALLHQISVGLRFHHPSGLFAAARSRWFLQDNGGYGYSIYTAPRASESTYQIDLETGWRVLRRRVEVSVGCENVTDQDYRLNSLTPFDAMPRERVWFVKVKAAF